MTDPHTDAQSPLASDEQDKETVYYEGTPLLRGELPLMLAWVGAGLVLLLWPIVWWFFKDQWPGAWWFWVGSMLLGVVLMFVPGIWVRRTRYRVTNYRIDYERGLFGKDIDTLELWHVDDISFRQSFVQRVLGVGTIMIDSGDRSTPNLPLKSIPNPRPLFDMMKSRIIAVKRQRGVIKMDMGGGGGAFEA